MAKKSTHVPPSPTQDEEMVVTVVRFRGSGETLRKGIDAVTQALTGAFGAPPVKVIGNGRKASQQLASPADPSPDLDVTPEPDEDGEDEQQEQQEQQAGGPAAAKTKRTAPKNSFMNELQLAPENG